MRGTLFIAALALLASAGAAGAQPGALVIVGGGLSRENAAIHEAFISRAGPDGRIAIVPAASAEPAASAQAFAETLARYGVAASRIDIVKLAVRDDEGTPVVDERTWAQGGADPTEIAKIERAGAIWMTGGDQARLTQTLYDAAGADTPMLAAMRRRLATGAVIGGTSAGAAVMSARMIAGGDSLTAMLAPVLRDGPAEEGALVLARGLGFLPDGIVDQHFGERARLGRLTRALSDPGLARRVGFGIDEDTALVVDLAAQTAAAIGAGSVTVVDATRALLVTRSGGFGADGVRLSLINDGDTVALSTLAVRVAPGKTRIAAGDERYDAPDRDGAGMAAPARSLEDTLGADLLDNSAARALERVSFRADGAGVIWRFAEDAASAAHYGGGRYGVQGVTFSIRPVRVNVRDAR